MLDTTHAADMRGHPRLQTRRAARLSIDGAWRDCVILNLSASGARLEIAEAPAVGEAVVLIDEDLGMIAATVCRRQIGEASVEFGVSDETKQELAAKLATTLSNVFLS